MRIILKYEQAVEIGYDESTANYIRACFFMGYSMPRIKELVATKSRRKELVGILNTAELMGMTDADTLEVKPKTSERRKNTNGILCINGTRADYATYGRRETDRDDYVDSPQGDRESATQSSRTD